MKEGVASTLETFSCYFQMSISRWLRTKFFFIGFLFTPSDPEIADMCNKKHFYSMTEIKIVVSKDAKSDYEFITMVTP